MGRAPYKSAKEGAGRSGGMYMSMYESQMKGEVTCWWCLRHISKESQKGWGSDERNSTR